MRQVNEEATQQLQQQHSQQLEGRKQELEASLPDRPKMSAEYLNLKRIEENMVKQKKFGEAHQIQ